MSLARFFGDINPVGPLPASGLFRTAERGVGVANLEGWLSGDTGRPRQDMGFTAEELGRAVIEWQLGAVSVANNHVLGGGTMRLDELTRELDRLGVDWFGTAERPWTVVCLADGSRLGLLGFVWRLTGIHSRLLNLAYLSVTRQIQQTRQLRSLCDFLVVFPHWWY